MGGCLSSSSQDESSQPSGGRRNESANQLAVGKNQPLKHELPRWKSELPLTLGQLASKRDEFWDTAPAFDGRKEIWDALKAAANACENKDFELAQAILNGANITIPHGYLTDCYDELGNRYQLPVYVLNQPANLQRDESMDESVADQLDSAPGDEVIIKLRLSTGKDLKLTVRSNHTVGRIKRILAKAENISTDQRWFYGGKVLQDKLKVDEVNVPKGHLIQVILPYDEPTININTITNSKPVISPTPVSS